MAFSSFVELFPCARGEGGDGSGDPECQIRGRNAEAGEGRRAGFGSDRARTMARRDLRGRRGRGKARGKCAAETPARGAQCCPQTWTRNVLVVAVKKYLYTIAVSYTHLTLPTILLV